jgi:8-oxo-dGTP diphosphatase
MKITQVFNHYQRQKVAPLPAEGMFRFCPYCAHELITAVHGNLPRPSCPSCGFVQFRNPSPAVSILLAASECVLLGLRSGEPRKGLWALPSGYIEFEDDFLSAAVREAREETGLEVTLTGIINVASSFYSPRYHFLGVYLAGRVVGGTLTAGDDLADVGWFPFAGPLPEMAYQEDLEAIRLFQNGDFTPLPIAPEQDEPAHL